MGRALRGLLLTVAFLFSGALIAHAEDSPFGGTNSGVVSLLGEANTDEVGDVAESWLFSVQAGKARTVPREATGGGSERFQLILNDVAPVTMFSDRPIRESRLISPRALVSNWGTWFEGDPPNAVISVPRVGRSPESFVVTLGEPMWRPAIKGLMFEVTRERERHDPQTKGANWKRPQTPREVEGVSVFIDGAFWRARDLQRPQKGAPPPPDQGIRPPLSLPTLPPRVPAG